MLGSPEVFERGRGYSQEKGVTLGGCGPALTLPGWIQSSPLTISPTEAAQSIVSAGSRRRCSHREPPSHQGGQPGCRSARGHPPAQATAVLVGNRTGGFMLCHC